MSEIKNIINAVVKGNEKKVRMLVKEAVNNGDTAGDVMNKGLIAAMDKVGEKMEIEEMFIPEVLMSASAMKAGVKVLKPHLNGEAGNSRGTVVLGSVQGDLHNIGKNLVKIMMEGAGFTVIDLGTDIKPDAFVKAAEDNSADIIGLSALLTTTMPQMEAVVSALEKAGLRDQVKVILGGAPVSETYAQEIGADGFGADAGSAVRIVKTFMSGDF